MIKTEEAVPRTVAGILYVSIATLLVEIMYMYDGSSMTTARCHPRAFSAETIVILLCNCTHDLWMCNRSLDSQSAFVEGWIVCPCKHWHIVTHCKEGM